MADGSTTKTNRYSFAEFCGSEFHPQKNAARLATGAASQWGSRVSNRCDAIHNGLYMMPRVRHALKGETGARRWGLVFGIGFGRGAL